MARKPYLEFSVEDRHACSKLYHLEVKAGIYPPLDKSGGCEACLMPFGNHGPIEGHREDYSRTEPDNNIFIICYRCHRVLHMRDRYPEGWEHYRELIRNGYRFNWTKDIGVVAGDMRNCAAPTSCPNEKRDRTILDDIHEGVCLLGTREDRLFRLQGIRDRLANWDNKLF